MNKRIPKGLLAGVLSLAAVFVAIGANTSADAATGRICEQYGSTVQGGYVVMNNRWGTSATQCIDVTANGFSIAQQDGVGNTSGAPVSYPAIYLGCHYGNCSPGFTPRQINGIGSATSSISDSYPGSGTWDAAYDIWLNADSNVSGVQDTEIMIWLNHQGSIQPIGSATGSANLAGRSWTVWTGNNGQNNVVSYIANSPTSSLSFSVLDFVRDTFGRSSQYGNNSWYLTSIQAGFEPWSGGVGLAVNSFSAAINGGTPPQQTSSTGSSTTAPPPTTPGGQTGACTATYTLLNAWGSGYQGQVTVQNNGSAPIKAWNVSLTLPGGQTATQAWNGSLQGSSGAVTVTNESYNGTIPAGGSTTFGFIVNGSGSSSPSALSCSGS